MGKAYHAVNGSLYRDGLFPHPYAVSGGWPVTPETADVSSQRPEPSARWVTSGKIWSPDAFSMWWAEPLCSSRAASTSPLAALNILQSGKYFASLDYAGCRKWKALSCVWAGHSFFHIWWSLKFEWTERVSDLQSNLAKPEMCIVNTVSRISSCCCNTLSSISFFIFWELHSFLCSRRRKHID